jgi:apolipoprotein N-acyltransferase
VDYSRFQLPDFNAISRRDYILAVLSGVLIALAFPKPAMSFLAWIAFVPLFLAIGKKTPHQAFRLGFIAGLTAYAGLLYWLNIVMMTYGKLHWSVSVSLFLILSAYLSIFVGVIAYLVRRAELAGISPLVSFPILWVGCEYLRAFLLTGFPWASLGYSQYRILPLVQIADVTGVYGVSFLIAFANIVLYRVIRAVVRRESAPYPIKSLALLLCLMAGTVGYGFFRLNQAEEGKPLKVGLIQGNISQDVKWDPAFQEATIAIYERLSRQAAAQGGIQLLVWPESATPFFFQDDVAYAARIKALVAELKTPLLFGSPAMEIVGGKTRYLNSAFLLSPSGEILGRSDKIHLVPFGEYVPLAKFLPFVKKLVVGIGDFSPGSRAVPLNTGSVVVGALVCFEGIFPEISRAYVMAGSRLLVNISNDAWYKRSSAPYQHLSMTTFRAIENRVPLVRATNTGITAIIDSRGHIRNSTSIFTEGVLTGEVRIGTESTIYTRYGDLFAGLSLIATSIIAIAALRRKSES